MQAKFNALVVLAGLACGLAHADSGDQQTGLYGGGDLGRTHWNEGVQGVDGKSSGASGKLFLGYQFTPYVGVEGGLVSYGRIEDPYGEMKANGEFIDAVGTLPVGSNWSLLGRLGAATPHVVGTEGDAHPTAFEYGVGAQYNITPALAVRGQWEHSSFEAVDDRKELAQYTMGVKVSF